MHGAFYRYIEQFSALFCGQGSGELHVTIDFIQLSFFGITIGTVLAMDSGMPQPHGDTFERPSLTARIHSDRHGSARTEGRKQEIVWRRSDVGAT